MRDKPKYEDVLKYLKNNEPTIINKVELQNSIMDKINSYKNNIVKYGLFSKSYNSIILSFKDILSSRFFKPAIPFVLVIFLSTFSLLNLGHFVQSSYINYASNIDGEIIINDLEVYDYDVYNPDEMLQEDLAMANEDLTNMY